VWRMKGLTRPPSYTSWAGTAMESLTTLKGSFRLHPDAGSLENIGYTYEEVQNGNAHRRTDCGTTPTPGQDQGDGSHRPEGAGRGEVPALLHGGTGPRTGACGTVQGGCGTFPLCQAQCRHHY